MESNASPPRKTRWRRFEERYRRRRQQSGGRFDLTKLLNVGGGILILLTGLVLVPAPGPGWLVVFFGLGLLGSEFLAVARFLDRSEVQLRKGSRRARTLWRALPWWLKVLPVVAVLFITAGTGLLLFHWLSGD